MTIRDILHLTSNALFKQVVSIESCSDIVDVLRKLIKGEEDMP
jgi:hypothetical protein